VFGNGKWQVVAGAGGPPLNISWKWREFRIASGVAQRGAFSVFMTFYFLFSIFYFLAFKFK
jgi:hypothetical protein